MGRTFDNNNKDIVLGLDLYHSAVSGTLSCELGDSFDVFKQKGPVEFPLYRALFLPTDLVKEGAAVEEWNGWTHWTPDIAVAKGFFAGCEAEEYVEDYGVQRGTDGTFEEGFKLFSSVMLRLDGAKNVLPVGRVLGELSKREDFCEAMDNDDFVSNDTLDDIVNEDEFTLLGYDFVINHVVEENSVFYVDVVQVERVREMVLVDEVPKPALDVQIAGAAEKAIGGMDKGKAKDEQER